MAARTYLPTLVRTLKSVCVYITRYRSQITSFLRTRYGENAVIALDAVMVACDAFTALVELDVNP